MQKAVDADIPVVLINAEIAKTGLAKAQIVSNNAQGATARRRGVGGGDGLQGHLRRAVRQAE